MPLNSKEVQLLTLLAKNRADPHAMELFREFEKDIRAPARALAKQILAKKSPAKKKSGETTAALFIRLADARIRARENRSFASPQ